MAGDVTRDNKQNKNLSTVKYLVAGTSYGTWYQVQQYIYQVQCMVSIVSRSGDVSFSFRKGSKCKKYFLQVHDRLWDVQWVPTHYCSSTFSTKQKNAVQITNLLLPSHKRCICKASHCYRFPFTHGRLGLHHMRSSCIRRSSRCHGKF